MGTTAPSCEPLGRHNMLIIANGLLAGTAISSSGRLSIGGKSPLTGGIKESNAGGLTATRMARNGLRCIIIEGLSSEKSLKLLLVEPSTACLLPADDLAGLGVYETARILCGRFPQSAITCIGPSGELHLSAAGIATIDKDGTPSRFSGRGGLGAVMGAKNIKAIIIKGKGTITPADPQALAKTTRAINRSINDAPTTKSYKNFGTAAMVEVINELNGLPIRNFSRGKDERASYISGDNLRDSIIKRGGAGRTAHSCMPGCLISCSNIYADQNGSTLVSPLEYETIGLLGSNLDIWNLDDIARLNHLCNDVGVDTIETGAALGVMMEAGFIPFGDFNAAADAIEEISKNTLLGRLIGSGAQTAGKVLGVKNVPTVKGQAMPAYDPRAVKGMGVTYATSAMGADHTAGPSARAQVDHHNSAGQAALSKKMQKLVGIFDSTGLCLFTVGGVAAHKQLLLDAINALHGWNYDLDWLDKLCEQMLQDERDFNELAGITNSHHRLPEAFTERKLPGIDTTFDVSEAELRSVFE